MCDSVTLKLRDALPPLDQVCNPLSLSGAAANTTFVNLESIVSDGYGTLELKRGEQAIFLSFTPDQTTVSDVDVHNLVQYVSLEALASGAVPGLTRISSLRQVALIDSTEESYGIGEQWVSWLIREVLPDTIDSQRVQQVRLTKPPVVTTQSYQLGATVTPITYACPGLTRVETPTQTANLDYVFSWRWGLPEVRNLVNLTFGMNGYDAGAVSNPTVYNVGTQFITPDDVDPGTTSDVWLRESDIQAVSFTSVPEAEQVTALTVTLRLRYVALETLEPPQFPEGYSVTHWTQYVGLQSVSSSEQYGVPVVRLKTQTIVMSPLISLGVGSLSIANKTRVLLVFGTNGFAITPFVIANVSASIRPNSVPMSYAVSPVHISDKRQTITINSATNEGTAQPYVFSPQYVRPETTISSEFGPIRASQSPIMVKFTGIARTINQVPEEVMVSHRVRTVFTAGISRKAIQTGRPKVIYGNLIDFQNFAPNIIALPWITIRNANPTLPPVDPPPPVDPLNPIVPPPPFAQQTILIAQMKGGTGLLVPMPYAQIIPIVSSISIRWDNAFALNSVPSSHSVAAPHIENLHRSISVAGVEGWVQPYWTLKFTPPGYFPWKGPDGAWYNESDITFLFRQVGRIVCVPKYIVLTSIPTPKKTTIGKITVFRANEIAAIGIAPPNAANNIWEKPRMQVSLKSKNRTIFQDGSLLNTPVVSKIGAAHA